MAKKTSTSSFGTTKRESHDSSSFYKRNIYAHKKVLPRQIRKPTTKVVSESVGEWLDKVYCQSSENTSIPPDSVALAFTSPPYNVGKDYDDDMSLDDYFALIKRVGLEVYRVLKPGGRYVINVANLGRKPYIPLHSYFYKIHQEVGFLPMGEIIWQKARGSSGNCAWGSWRSAKAPRLRDVHEYLLVFAKGDYSRDEKGQSDVSAEEFMASTLSIWYGYVIGARSAGTSGRHASA